MKSIYLLITSCAFLFMLSCKENKNAVIQGEIKNLSEGVLFAYTENSQTVEIDTITLSPKGKFKLEKKLPEASIVTIMFPDKSFWVPLYVLTDEKIEVKGDANNTDDFKIKGSSIQKEIESFRKTNNELFIEESRLSKEIDRKTFQGNEGAADRTRFLSNLNGVKKRITEAAEIYIKKNPEQIASAIILNEYLFKEGAMSQAGELLNTLEDKAEEFILTQQMEKHLEDFRKTDINSKAPNFKVKTIDGDSLSLDAYKGEILLLSFTASWCDFCKLESKTLSKCSEQHKDSDIFNIVSISLDQENSDWVEYAKEHNITWKQITDSTGDASSILELYNIHEVPYAVLIDTAGIIIGRGNSCDEFRDILQKEIPSKKH
ncbi:MAG: TlpA disulfide reductase family protein [Bacteroidales bacterium]|nr:TlpA disulfide reductase family protein [Bacteroidales bacterium]